MFWIIGVLTTYFVIGLILAWLLSTAGGERFKLNKEALPYIITWPKLLILLFLMNKR